jgi:hypothetical protein
MEQSNKQNTENIPVNNEPNKILIDPKTMDNAVLARLIGEIDFEKENRIHSYNRTHNRHNRGR